MNRKQLMTITLILSLLGIGTPGFAQDAAQNPAAEEPAAAPTEPVTGYHGMLPYIQENANMRKEAARKYASENPRKKSKKSKSKSKVKSASKKKSRTTASTKKSSSKKKKSPGKRQGSP
ncbi:hypothetical protein [Bdellovibrio sp. HCB209]|uniref:hypothetical protein n=1 Tax=Bdellovibrio sp. HCB209 TaxID=3394354 RepID=UPI0039B6AC66